MWFGYDDENSWYPLDVERVNEILALNKEGKKPSTLALDKMPEVKIDGKLNSDLDAMDRKFSGGNQNKKKKKRKFNKNRNPNNPGTSQNPPQS
jgi:hypothetical protein